MKTKDKHGKYNDLNFERIWEEQKNAPASNR